MSDLQLLTFGCAITFLAVAGAYVALREQIFSLEREPVRVRARQPRRRAEGGLERPVRS